MTGVGERIEVEGLNKHFGAVHAVRDMTFTVEPGRVTGFLGPNGAGKTTTLRCLLGLITPSSGSATIGGRRYQDLADPIGTVGAALEASNFHPGRSARNHLRVVALAGGVPDVNRRVDEVLTLVGLRDAARRRVGGFSLGMRQRLALASALLGDPSVLALDEPANGLDPAGIAWLRDFLRHLAAEGRTVLVSSHVLSEVQQTVEDVLIINHGELVRQGRLRDLDDPSAHGVVVRTPQPERLADVLAEQALRAEPGAEPGLLRVPGTTPAQVGRLAFQHHVELHELSAEHSDLESVFLQLTREDAS